MSIKDGPIEKRNLQRKKKIIEKLNKLQKKDVNVFLKCQNPNSGQKFIIRGRIGEISDPGLKMCSVIMYFTDPEEKDPPIFCSAMMVFYLGYILEARKERAPHKRSPFTHDR